MINGAIEAAYVLRGIKLRTRFPSLFFSVSLSLSLSLFLQQSQSCVQRDIVQTARHVIRKIKETKGERGRKAGCSGTNGWNVKKERIYVTVDERVAVYI